VRERDLKETSRAQRALTRASTSGRGSNLARRTASANHSASDGVACRSCVNSCQGRKWGQERPGTVRPGCDEVSRPGEGEASIVRAGQVLTCSARCRRSSAFRSLMAP